MAKPSGEHREKKLNALAVKRATKPGRMADGGGLYLVIGPAGGKYWIFRGVVKGQKDKKGKPLRVEMGLGGVAEVSLAEARELAAEARKKARNGISPVRAREEERREAATSIPTFKEAAEKVHAEHSPSWRNPKHRQQWINSLKAYAFPIIGEMTVDEIGSREARDVLLPIWLEKPETARRVRQRIGAVLDWAIAEEHRTTANPVGTITKSLPKQNDTPKHHEALPYAEVPAFLEAMRDFDADRRVKLAMELLVLTAMRTSETINAHPTEFDLKNAIWSIPATRMKKKRPHRVPLSPRAVEVVREALEMSSDDFLFPGRRPGKPLSNMALAMLMRRMEVKATPHGLRSSFRDWAGERSGFPREVAEAALAHVVRDATEAAYARTDYFDQRKAMMDQWASFLAGGGDNVVALRPGA